VRPVVRFVDLPLRVSVSPTGFGRVGHPHRLGAWVTQQIGLTDSRDTAVPTPWGHGLTEHGIGGRINELGQSSDNRPSNTSGRAGQSRRQRFGERRWEYGEGLSSHL
jgi:hypothetical protein